MGWAASIGKTSQRIFVKSRLNFMIIKQNPVCKADDYSVMINSRESLREDLKVSEIHLGVKIPELQEWWTVPANFQQTFSEMKSASKMTGRWEVWGSTEPFWNVIGPGIFSLAGQFRSIGVVKSREKRLNIATLTRISPLCGIWFISLSFMINNNFYENFFLDNLEYSMKLFIVLQ